MLGLLAIPTISIALSRTKHTPLLFLSLRHFMVEIQCTTFIMSLHQPFLTILSLLPWKLTSLMVIRTLVASLTSGNKSRILEFSLNDITTTHDSTANERCEWWQKALVL